MTTDQVAAATDLLSLRFGPPMRNKATDAVAVAAAAAAAAAD